MRLLRCTEVCGIVAPESSVAAVVADLRRMAKAADHGEYEAMALAGHRTVHHTGTPCRHMLQTLS